jgi:hypothetical protein
MAPDTVSAAGIGSCALCPESTIGQLEQMSNHHTVSTAGALSTLEATMRISMSPLMNEYVLRGFIALALVICRVKLGALVPRRIRRR